MVFFALALGGMATMWMAVIADVGAEPVGHRQWASAPQNQGAEVKPLTERPLKCVLPDKHFRTLGADRRPSQTETLTSPIKTGTSTSGPMTVANAVPEAMPKTEIATAIASSKLLPVAVKVSVAELARSPPPHGALPPRMTRRT